MQKDFFKKSIFLLPVVFSLFFINHSVIASNITSKERQSRLKKTLDFKYQPSQKSPNTSTNTASFSQQDIFSLPGGRSSRKDNSLIATISSPQDGDYLVASSTIEIRGTADGSAFQSYALEYAAGRDPLAWNLIVTDTNPVSNGIFTQWSTQGKPAGVYTLRLTVTSSGGQTLTYTEIINLGAKAGWPQIVNGNASGTMVSGDVDGDGKKEIICTTDHQIYVFRPDGTYLSFWPMSFEDGIYVNAATLADLDKDGKLDIILVLYNTNFAPPHYTLMALRYNGTNIEGFPFELQRTFNPVVVADLDKNGYPEILVRTEETNCPLYVYEYNPQGNPKLYLKWERDTSPSYHNLTPSVADIDGDGYLEVVVTADSNPLKIYVFDKNGNTVSGWPQPIYDKEFNDPAVLGDIAGDKKLEIVVTAMTTDSNYSRLYAFDSSGNSLFNDPPLLYYDQSPVLTDIDNDGKNEIIGNRSILKVNNSGGVDFLAQWEPVESGLSAPLVVDITNDAGHIPEILFGSLLWNDDINYLYAYQTNGLPLTNFNLVNFPLELEGFNGYRSALVDDLDNDGKLELVVDSLVEPYAYDKIYIWELGSFSKDSLGNSWTMPYHDSQRTNAIVKVSKDVYVPSDYSTIQKAISVALDGQTIHVAPGIYNEQINFQGKKIKIVADQGAENTIIQASNSPYTVSFISSEGRESALQGFTVINTYPSSSETSAVAIYCNNSSPTITNNIIKAQSGTRTSGTGIRIDDGKPLIIYNTISYSSRYGIAVINKTAPKYLITEISYNTISHNNYAGIKIDTTGSGGRENIQHNIIDGNGTDGIWITSALAPGAPDPQIINNTIVNTASVWAGTGIEVGSGSPAVIGNIIASNSYYGVYVNGGSTDFSHGFNDIWNNKKGDYYGITEGVEDIHSDPQFSDSAYHILSTSPCINAGFPFLHDPDGTRSDIGAFPYSTQAISHAVQNSSFEIDSGTDFYPNWTDDDSIANNNLADGWTTGFGILDTLFSYDGSKSMKIYVNNSRGYSVQDVPIERNKIYKVSGYVKTDCVDNNCYGTILTECMDANHTNIWGYDNCKLNTNPSDIQRLYGDNDWTKVEFTVQADNPNASFLRTICYNTPYNPYASYSYPGTGTVWCDAVNVTEVGY